MQPGSVFAFTVWLLLQLLHEPLCSNFTPMGPEAKEDSENPFAGVECTLMGPQHDSHALFTAGLHNYKLCTMFQMFDEDLGYWVRPRSTMWFSRFFIRAVRWPPLESDVPNIKKNGLCISWHLEASCPTPGHAVQDSNSGINTCCMYAFIVNSRC